MKEATKNCYSISEFIKQAIKKDWKKKIELFYLKLTLNFI